MGRLTQILLGSLAAACAFATGSCADPVHDLQVKGLGGEDPNTPQGEFHRAGQPCVVCHQPGGPANTSFSIAGTIFANDGKDKIIGVENVYVDLVDANGSFWADPAGNPLSIKTNCAGNFWVSPSDWDPAFPVRVMIRRDATVTKMISHIGREPSCNRCHGCPPDTTSGCQFLQSYNSPGVITINVDPKNATQRPDCPINPEILLPGTP
jgi:hypothetical protein